MVDFVRYSPIDAPTPLFKAREVVFTSPKNFFRFFNFFRVI